MSRSIRWQLAMALLLSTALVATASGTGSRTMDYAWLLFLKVNEPPVVDAGIDLEITWATDSVYLDATVTDDPRDTLTYEWTKLDGPGDVSFTPPDTEDTTATFSVASGTYILQLSASDGKLTSTSTVAIILNNSAPEVNAGTDKTLYYPTLGLFLNATASDDPMDSLSYTWSKVNGPGSVTFSSPAAEDTSVTFSESGVYTLQLGVSDGDLASIDQANVTIINNSPAIDAGPDKQTTQPDNNVYLDATVTDSTSSILTYQWTKVSGPGTAVFSNPSAVDTNVSMYTVGTYDFQLRVSDGELASTDTVTVEYLPQSVDKIDVIVAVGDSITVGFGDDDCIEGDAKACSGYTPKLKAFLDSIRGYSHTIYERGTGGKTSAYGRLVIDGIISDHPAADQYLVMYGTNDANAVPIIPSGYGLSTTHPDYPGTFKDNMGVIIYKIKSSSTDDPPQPVLAKAPYAKVSQAWRNTCTSDEIADGEDNCILRYNLAVAQLVNERSLTVSPPDFYTWFQNHQDEIHSVFLWDPTIRDDLHPTHDGYWSMARLWRDQLIK